MATYTASRGHQMSAPPAQARLLLVDDDEAACRMLGEVLERESYTVLRALSVRDALALYDREGPFDAVLTDLRMPEASGLDLLAAIRQRQPEALVLVLTLGMLVSAIRSWWDRGWGVPGRLFYAFVTLMSIVFLGALVPLGWLWVWA